MPLKAISELQSGDLVDLQGDRYADNGSHPELEFEYCEVDTVERETADCIRVDFLNICVGFPPDHRVEVVDART